ncbi:hypothetical protein D3C84_464710 [compost metagenome]
MLNEDSNFSPKNTKYTPPTPSAVTAIQSGKSNSQPRNHSGMMISGFSATGAYSLRAHTISKTKNAV